MSKRFITWHQSTCSDGFTLRVNGEFTTSMSKACTQVNEEIDEQQKEIQALRELIKSYCCCSSMGSTGGQCCFCEVLKKLEKGE